MPLSNPGPDLEAIISRMANQTPLGASRGAATGTLLALGLFRGAGPKLHLGGVTGVPSPGFGS